MREHYQRASAVLDEAIRQAVEGHILASGPLIRQRVESCLSTALARCREDPIEIYDLIDEERERQR